MRALGYLSCLTLVVAAQSAQAQVCEATAGANCYYISPSGSDELDPSDNCQGLPSTDCSSGGTFDSPWKSIAKAASCSQPGDVTYLRAGTYGTSCTTYPNGWVYTLYTLRSGTAAAPITFKAYPGEAVLLTEQVQLNSPGANGNEGDYTVVEGFEVITQGINIYGAHVVIRNNHVHDVNHACSANNAGIRLDNGTQHAVIEGNVIHDNFERDNGDDWRDVAGFSTNCAGIKFMHDPEGNVVRNNEIYNEPACIHLKYQGEGTDTLIENNIFHDCGDAVYGSNNSWTFRHNVVHDTPNGLRVGGANAGLIGGNGVLIEFNTFANNGNAVVLRSGDPRVNDNIFANAGADYQTYVYDGIYGNGEGYPDFDISSLSLDRNCYFTSGDIYRYGHDGQPNYYYDLANVQTTFSQEGASVFADPQFADPANLDFEPATGSPCEAMGAFASGGSVGPDGGAAGQGGSGGGGLEGGAGGSSTAGTGGTGGSGATAGGGGSGVTDGGVAGAPIAETSDDSGCGCRLASRRGLSLGLWGSWIGWLR